LVARPDVTAVVAANDEAAITYIATLHESGVPVERWPAVVGYDNLPNPKGQILSSMHRPLDRIGAAAADILWERWTGKIKGPAPVRRRIPMVLLPRMTSESGWALRMPDAISMLLESIPPQEESWKASLLKR
jgi:DNA-binding LacI/PurR family transcriptional regulator